VVTSSRWGRSVTGIVGAARRFPGRMRVTLFPVATIAALGAGQLATAFMQIPPDEPSPKGGTAQVVAQGVVDIGDGDLRWQVTDRTAPPPANATTMEGDLGFITVDSGAMLVDDRGSGDQYRLPAGEAILTRAGEKQLRVALGSEAASYREISLVDAAAAEPADATVVYLSEPFAGLGARHDLDLLQDALAPGATMALPAGSLPSLVLILDGSADVTTEGGDVVSLGDGEAAALDGQLTLTAGDNGASVAATHMGPAVPRMEQAVGTPRSGRAVESEQPEAAATPSARAVATRSAADATDDDGDGLTAAEEANAGTDPALADTDEDGLTDGQEVHEIGTDPLRSDSDGDGVLDGDEVAQGSDPLNGANEQAVAEATVPAEESAAPTDETTSAEAAPGDSDGDGLEDSIEVQLGTDPNDVDTDDDGLTDGDEYYVYQTGTRNPDTDGDGVDDGTEVSNGTDPNDPSSF
jgi:hypothetical protein